MRFNVLLLFQIGTNLLLYEEIKPNMLEKIEDLDKPRLIFGFPSLYSGFGLSGSCTRHSGVDGKGAKETSTLKTKSPPQQNLKSMPKKTPN